MNNPFLEENNQPYNSVPFELIKSNHFLPAIKHYIAVTEGNIDKICKNIDKATFENTIEAFEAAGEDLDYVATVYYHMFSSEADDEIKELIKEINPLTTKLSNDIFLNEQMFKRIQDVNTNKDMLNKDECRLLEEIYHGFIKSGANLDDSSKNRYREISQELSALSPKFSNNVLNATNSINEYWLDDNNDFDGLPSNVVQSAKSRAVDKDKAEKWCFSLDTDAMLFLQFCNNRNVRKDILMKMSTKCNGGEFNNFEILKKISKLRHERANLLGFDTHADFILDRRMAKTKQTVYNFIDELLTPSLEKANKELIEISEYAKKIDSLENLKQYDVSYYREKYKQSKFDFNEEELRPYFKAENVVDGAFTVANKLYGLNFELLKDVQIFHPEVKVYKVSDDENKYVGLLYQDLHPRKTKRGGAWMNQLHAKGLFKGKNQEPHVTMNCNLTRSTEDKPALLSINEVRTIFHEFGHCLHGLLTDVKYKTLGAMGVYWDFVELPSQILENWLKEPEVLNIFAKHYDTGEVIPKEYIDKINESKQFMLGMFSLRQLHLCKIDMSWHDGVKDPKNIEEYESSLLENCTVVKKEPGAAVSTAFSHIFSGGYSAGYYSYKWAELLEADAYEKFEKEGIFNKSTATSFKENILSKGNTDHPMNLFKNFMGREPKIDALLRKGGLIKHEELA